MIPKYSNVKKVIKMHNSPIKVEIDHFRLVVS